tara:strand:+ start:469 stop:714 length:246 start_codon:yes stop_codon:yes gene_type:complete
MKVEIKKMKDFDKVDKEIVWEGTLEQIFNKFYHENNRLRYCNGCSFKFKDEYWVGYLYDEWFDSLTKEETFKMYYGNGVVD